MSIEMNTEKKRVETVFRNNGREYEFDMRDAADAAKYEDAIERLKEMEKAIPKDGRASDLLIAHCEMIRAFFDTCFGEGAGVMICGDKFNVSNHYDAYERFVMMARDQNADVRRSLNTFGQHSNRQQRRSKKKKNSYGH